MNRPRTSSGCSSSGEIERTHHIWSWARLAATLIRCRSDSLVMRPDAAALAGRDDQGEEHDVPFVALEVVGVAAADPAPFHLLLTEARR